MSPTTDRRALIVLLLGAMAIGWSPILVRLGGAGPAATGFWRLFFAMPWFLILIARPGAPGDGRRALRTPLIWLGAAFFATDLGFWHYGIHFTSVANATVLSNLTPILVTIVAALAFKERPRPVFLIGLTVAVLGAVGMAVFKAGVGGRAPSYLGDILSVMTAVWYGGYFLVVRQARQSFSTVAVMLGSSLPGLPLLALAALLLGEGLWPVGAGGWAAMAALGLVHVCGQGAIAWALGRLPTALAAVVVLVQPVIAAALGWLIFAEAMTPLQALAAGLALVGVAIAQTAARPPQPVEAPEA